MNQSLRTSLLSLIVLALLSAAPVADPDHCVRQGNAAFARGDYALALEWYGRAEERSTDPGLVALNKAAAFYRLGDYKNAELNYRRSLEDAEGPRRARLLHDLGACLLQRSQGKNVKALEEAIDVLEACLHGENLVAALRERTRFNLELAKLLWLEARKASQPPKPDEPPGGKDDPSLTRKPNDKQGTTEPGATLPDPNAQGQPTKPAPGTEPATSETEQPNPGAGNLGAIPDTKELVPLSPEDAAAHLRAAVERIRMEQMKSKVQGPRSKVQNAMDR